MSRNLLDDIIVVHFDNNIWPSKASPDMVRVKYLMAKFGSLNWPNKEPGRNSGNRRTVPEGFCHAE